MLKKGRHLYRLSAHARACVSCARVYCTTMRYSEDGPSSVSERSSSTVVRVWFMRMCRSMCLCCLAGAAQTVRVCSGMPSLPVVLNMVTNTYRWSSSIIHVTVLCTALVIYIAVVVLDDACGSFHVKSTQNKADPFRF